MSVRAELVRGVASSGCTLFLGVALPLTFGGDSSIAAVLGLYAGALLCGAMAAVAHFRLVRRSRLKNRASDLSRRIMVLLSRRDRRDAQTIRMGHEEYAARSMESSAELMASYHEDFAAAALAVFDQLAAAGVVDNERRHTFEHPTNPLGVREVAMTLGAGAERL